MPTFSIPNRTVRTLSDLSQEPGICQACGFGSGEPGFLRLDVPPGHPQFGKLVKCPACNDSRMQEVIRKRVQSNTLEGDLVGCTFDSYIADEGDPAALKAAIEFAAKPNFWLTFYGGYGRGKTHLAAAIHNEMLKTGVKSYFVEFPNLTSQLRQAVGRGDSEVFYQHLSQYPVLIIDEVDKGDLRNWTQEQAFRLFNRRNNLKGETGTVLVMNAEPEIGDPDLGYLFSRMMDSRNKCIQIKGKDKRGMTDLLVRIAKAVKR